MSTFVMPSDNTDTRVVSSPATPFRQIVTRRTVLAATLPAAALPVVIAGCGQTGGDAPALAKQPVTLDYTVDIQEATPEGKAHLDILQEFNRTNPSNITVNLDSAKVVTDVPKLKILAAAGTPPAFAKIYFTEGPELFAAGATVELESLLKKEKEWAKQRADMFPGIIDAAIWGGKLTSLPIWQNVTGFVYNPQLLAKSGVPFPASGWTWNDFKAAAQRASDPPRSWGLSFKWNMGHFSAWVGGLGVGLVSPDRRKMALMSPECLEATEFIVGMARTGLTSPTVNQELFRKGTNEAVFELQGPFRMGVFRAAGIDFGVVHHPVHPTKKLIAAFGDGKDEVIFKGIPTATQDAAARTLVWLNGPYPQGLIGAAAIAMPISKAGNESKELAAYLKTDPQFKAFIDIAPHVRTPRFPAMASYNKMVYETINPALAEIFGQKVSVRDGLAQLERVTQQILDEDLKQLK